MAAIKITGALRTSPTDLLNAHADLVPMELRIKKNCHRAALRIATLPDSHPLKRPAKDAFRCYVQRHRAPLHEIMRLLTIGPGGMETIEPVRQHPGWISGVTTEIAGTREDGIAGDLFNTDEVRVYSDGSGLDGQIGAAAILLRGRTHRKVLRFHLGSSRRHTVYEAECVGQLLAFELVRKERDVGTVTLGVDNQASIRGIHSVRPSPGHYLLDEMHRRIKELQRRHEDIALKVVWVPGHEGVVGNEWADEEAKKASQGESSSEERLPAFLREDLPASKSAVKQAYAEKIKRQVAKLFAKSPRYTKANRIDRHMPSSHFRKIAVHLSRSAASLLVQLRMGHVPLNQYLYRFKRAESPLCPMCNGEEETVSHWLHHCPAYEGHRAAIRQALGDMANSTSRLLSDPKAIPHLVGYINATRRFESPHGVITIPEFPKKKKKKGGKGVG